MKTDEPEAAADENRAPQGASRAPAPPAETLATADPTAAEDVRQDEAAALRHLTARMKAAYPSVAPSVVDQVIATARGPFQQAKVRTYVPILVERRVRALLAGLAGEGAAPSPASVGDPGSGEPRTAGTAERSAGSPRRSPLLGRWLPARLRPAPASASDLGGVGEGR
ncbi:three-helix bundle dimerization domain-containing protein [Streptomyces sp. NPDC096324]|uniref:three-helix bundle dimerization domain-containing protein n=1 Tax=Streptomyces sp. NPDC096324 TaxID=3366085 RepID=UPI00382BDE1A